MAYSPSQINMFIRCPAQWMFRYVEGLKKPPTIALTFGSAFDDGVSVNFEQKIESHEDCKLDVVQDAFVTSFDARVPETEVAYDEDPAAIKDMGVKLIAEHHKVIAPKVQPIGVQVDITFERDGFEFRGILDVTESNRVRDTKTTARTPSSVSEDHARQMTFYDMAYESLYGVRPETVELDYLVKTKTPKAVTLPVPERDTKHTLNVVRQVDKAIKAEAFIPNRGNFLCSRRHCGFWAECEAEYGGRVKE